MSMQKRDILKDAPGKHSNVARTLAIGDFVESN